MAVQVAAPEKKEDQFGKIMAIGKFAMDMKNMKSGGSGPTSATAMTRRMQKLQADDEEANKPYSITGAGSAGRRPYAT